MQRIAKASADIFRTKVVAYLVRNYNSIYDTSMSESNLDPNPTKYLAVNGNDQKFKSALRNLNNTDEEIGEEASAVSNKAMIRNINTVIVDREEEIKTFIKS